MAPYVATDACVHDLVPAAAKTKLLKPPETAQQKQNRDDQSAAQERAARAGDEFISLLNGDKGRKAQRAAFDELDSQVKAGGGGSMTKQRVMMRMLASPARLVPEMMQLVLDKWAPARKELEAAEAAEAAEA